MATSVNPTIDAEALTDKEKEHCAVAIMRRMLEKFSAKHKVPFDTAFFQFTNSYVYQELFDYDTGVWSEGPDYLMGLFEESQQL